MPKYIPKKNRPPKTPEKAELRKEIEQKKEKFIFIPKIPKLHLITIFVISSVISIYFINQKINFLSRFLPVSDETEIIRRVTGGIEETGLPYNIFPKSSPNRKMSIEEVKKNLHYKKNFREEVYLRYLVFKMSDYFNFNWYSFSNLFWFCIIILILSFNFIFRKKTEFPVTILSFLILLLALSHWYSASFHYVRYYFFLMTAQIISFIASAYIFLNNKSKFKILFLLIIAYIPTEFHPQGAFNIIFWLFVVIINEIRQTITDKNSKKTKRLIISGLFLVIFLIIFLKFSSGIFRIALSKLSFENMPGALYKFIQLNFPQTYFGIIINILIITGGIFSLKYLSNFEKKLLKFTLIFFIISILTAASFVGGNYSGFNGINRYFSFAHATYLIIPAIFLSGILKFTVSKFKKTYLYIPGFVVLSLILISNKNLITNSAYKNYNFSILPYIEKNEINKIKKELKDINYDVICSHEGNASIAFPHKRTYQISNVKHLKEVISEDKYLFFFRVNPGKLKPELQNIYLQIPMFSYHGALINTRTIRNIMNRKQP